MIDYSNLMERSIDGQGFVDLFHWVEYITYHESEEQLQYLLKCISLIYLDCFHHMCLSADSLEIYRSS